MLVRWFSFCWKVSFVVFFVSAAAPLTNAFAAPPECKDFLSNGNPLIEAVFGGHKSAYNTLVEPRASGQMSYDGLFKFLVSRKKWRTAEALAKAGFIVQVHPQNRNWNISGVSPLGNLHYQGLSPLSKPDFLIFGAKAGYHYFNYLNGSNSTDELITSMQQQISARLGNKFVIDFSTEDSPKKLESLTASLFQDSSDGSLDGLLEIFVITKDGEATRLFP